MERLTRTIITTGVDVDYQEALNKLAVYEDAEERGELIKVPQEAYYIQDGKVKKGPVWSISYNRNLTQPINGAPDFVILYTIETGEEDTFKGILGVDVFADLNDIPGSTVCTKIDVE